MISRKRQTAVRLLEFEAAIVCNDGRRERRGRSRRSLSERSDQTSVEGTRIPLVRRERFMTRRLLASLCITAAAFVLTAQAQTVKIDPAKVKTTGTSDKDFNAERLAAEQQQLKMEFLEFKQQLL